VATAALVVIGLGVAIWGATTAALDVPEAGVAADPPGGVIHDVLPGTPGWYSGIRPGQTVVDIAAGPTELDWVLHSRGPVVEYYLAIRGVTAELRAMLPLALGGLLLTLFAVAAANRWPRAAAAIAVLGGMVGARPLVFDGHPLVSSFGGLVMLALPVACLTSVGLRGGRRRGLAIFAALVVGAAWLGARFVAPAAWEPAETVRAAASLVAAGTMAWVGVDRRVAGSAIESLGAPTALDLAGLAVVVGLAVPLWVVADASAAVIGLAVAATTLAYVRFRRPLVGGLDKLLFGEVRVRSSLDAIEAERGRIARDIHDEPLQELSGVISRLESKPESAAEAGALRDVAAHLRAVATDLQSPVLEDLGLGPAIAFLAQGANANVSSVRVGVGLDDQTGVTRSDRLPAEVELALYRILQEAIGNAQRHSGGSRVEVTGTLAPGFARLTISDDGVGLGEGSVHDARRRGRLGMDSMRRRAAAIGATLEITAAAPRGTAVTVRWGRS
jgi:signal transduction histidine kinase